MKSPIDEVRELAARYSGRAVTDISENTRLFHDLAIDGDHAEELLLEIFSKYELPTENFPFAKYFGSEFGAGWRHLFIVRLGIRGGVLAPLTVGEVASWAQARSWRVNRAA
jgi:hypothetical protein